MRPLDSVYLRAAFGLLATLLCVDAALATVGARGLDVGGAFGLTTIAELGAGALVVARVVLVREQRLVWAPLAAGIGAYAVGCLIAAFSSYPAVVSSQTVPNVLWFALYPGAYATAVLLVRERLRAWDHGLWLDGFIAALAVAACGAAFVFHPYLVEHAAGPHPVANLTYPLADLTLLAFLVALGLRGVRPLGTWTALAGAFAVLVVCDTLYVLLPADGRQLATTLVGTGWGLGLAVLALAAWLPGVSPADARAPARGLGRLALALPAAAVALGLLVAGAGRVGGIATGLAVATVGCSLARMAWSVVLEGRLHATRAQAMTDELTGLGNRRRLLEDLTRVLQVASAEDPRALVLFDLNGFKHYNDTFGHLAGDVLLRQLGLQLAAAAGDFGSAYRLGGDEFCALVHGDPRTIDKLLPELEAALSDQATPVSVGCSAGVALLPLEATETSAALALADRRMYERKLAERRSTRLQMRDLLLAVVQEQHPDLHGHSADVSHLCREVGLRIGLAAAELDLLVLAAELHDIGKVAIPDAVVAKAGPLDEREWQLMRTHTVIAERMLLAVPPLAPVGVIVRATHERWDGFGYPDGLSGEEIPIAARVIAACDAYDAMTTDRPYRDAISADEAVAELRSCSGAQFDPIVVEALLSVLVEGAVAPERARLRRLSPSEPRLSAIASLRGLLEVTRLVRRAGSLETVLDAIASTISESLGLDTVVINLRRPGSEVFEVTTVHGSDEVREGLLGTTNGWEEWEPLLDSRFDRRGAFHIRAGEYDWTALEGKRVVVGDVQGHEPWLWHPEDELFVPFFGSDGELLGILSLGDPRSGLRPSDDELDVLVAMAEHAGVAVESLHSETVALPALTHAHFAG